MSDPIADYRDAPTLIFEEIVSQAMKLVVYVTVPGILLFAGVELLLGRSTPILGGYAVTQILAVLTYFATKQRSFQLRASFLATYALATVFLSLLHYGANIGTGVAMVGAAVWSGMVLGRRGAAFVALAVTLVMLAVGLGSSAGVLPTPAQASQDVRSVANWIRFVVTMTLCAAGTGWLVMRVLSSLESSVARAREVFFERELERERYDKAERELERAQRLDALGRLAAGVGRDINNALSVVHFNAKALASTDNEQQRELADEIIAAVLTARDTTQELAALSERAPITTEHAPLDDAIARALRGLERVVPSSIEIRTELDVPGDIAMPAEAFERVLMNLCVNARDAMADGGTLTIRSALSESASEVLVEVRDTGRGLSHEVREHMFEPFFTTKADGDGTGLGLTTVHRLVAAAGGRIDVHSEQGEGTTFRIHLPIARPTGDRDGDREVPSAPSASLRILLVEDEPSVCRVFARVLRSAGHEVEPAETGDAALEVITSATDLDVLITDAGLPGAGVDTIIASYIEHFPNGRVVVCSGQEEEEAITDPNTRYDVFLRKPLGPDELLASLR